MSNNQHEDYDFNDFEWLTWDAAAGLRECIDVLSDFPKRQRLVMAQFLAVRLEADLPVDEANESTSNHASDNVCRCIVCNAEITEGDPEDDLEDDDF
jgi:hypothetical protein